MMPEDGCESTCLFFLKKTSKNKKEPRRAEKNDTIVESYRFVSRVVSYFCNKYRK